MQFKYTALFALVWVSNALPTIVSADIGVYPFIVANLLEIIPTINWG
jgi:hypothetical protein